MEGARALGYVGEGGSRKIQVADHGAGVGEIDELVDARERDAADRDEGNARCARYARRLTKALDTDDGIGVHLADRLEDRAVRDVTRLECERLCELLEVVGRDAYAELDRKSVV
jgi:hypothetical protein